MAQTSVSYISTRWVQAHTRAMSSKRPSSSIAASASNEEALHPSVLSQDIRCFIESCYGSARQNIFSLHTTGGGATAISWLFSVPGASRSILEASVPYARSALGRVVNRSSSNDIDDCQIENFCSRNTANKMASSALKSSVEMTLIESQDLRKLQDANIVGLGCTAAIASAAPKKGEHRCFVSYAKANAVVLSAEIVMKKGFRTREEEDSLCSKMIMDTLQASISTDEKKSSFEFTNSILCEEEHISQSVTDRSNDLIDDIRENKSKMCLFVPKNLDTPANEGDGIDNFICYDDINLPSDSLIYPGSFNPLHAGHVELALASIKSARRDDNNVPLIFEISATNADKPSLEKSEIIRRLQQFCKYNGSILANAGIENYGVCITSEPLFRAKSTIFPHCKFILGVDTLSRLINTKYYGYSGNAMISSFQSMRERGCSFIVGGRAMNRDTEQSFESLDTVLKGILNDDKSYDNNDVRATLVALLQSMSIAISESDFRVDLSSTEIRMKLGNP